MYGSRQIEKIQETKHKKQLLYMYYLNPVFYFGAVSLSVSLAMFKRFV
jgi:tryptophan synthase alpha subunit